MDSEYGKLLLRRPPKVGMPWFSVRCEGGISVSFHPRVEIDANGPSVICMDVDSDALIIPNEYRAEFYHIYEQNHWLMQTYFQVVYFDNVDWAYPKSIFKELLNLDLTDDERSRVNQHLAGFTCIYLIRDDDTGLTKIGRSDNPEGRLKQLIKQDTLMPTPNRFRIVRTWEDYPYIEKSLHKHFADKRVRGEWFRLSEEDVEKAFELGNAQ